MGVTFDLQFKFDKHIDYKINKASSFLGVWEIVRILVWNIL